MILAVCRRNVKVLLRIGEPRAALAEGLGGLHSPLGEAHLVCHVVLHRSSSQGSTLWCTIP